MAGVSVYSGRRAQARHRQRGQCRCARVSPWRARHHATLHMNDPALPSDPSRLPPPRRWILVVDDEPSMRLLIEVVLNSQGWPAVCVDGAEGALHALKAHEEPPAVVICDVLMPGLDGLELVRRMCARILDLNVIFISGRLSDVSG